MDRVNAVRSKIFRRFEISLLFNGAFVRGNVLPNYSKECTVNVREGFAPKQLFVGQDQNSSSEESVSKRIRREEFKFIGR